MGKVKKVFSYLSIKTSFFIFAALFILIASCLSSVTINLAQEQMNHIESAYRMDLSDFPLLDAESPMEDPEIYYSYYLNKPTLSKNDSKMYQLYESISNFAPFFGVPFAYSAVR